MAARIEKVGDEWALLGPKGQPIQMPFPCGKKYGPVKAATREEVEHICISRLLYFANIAKMGLVAPIYGAWPMDQ
jgi:hypothetical protein